QDSVSYFRSTLRSLTRFAHGVLRLALQSALPVLLCLAFVPSLRADTISGTIKDPTGATVSGATVEITGGSLNQPLVVQSDDSGKFIAPNLSPGKYSIRVTKDGFADNITQAVLSGTAQLDIKLALAEQQTSVTVSEKALAFANSDPFYRQLRDIGL